MSEKLRQIKCEKCGSTDISQNPKTGKLRCNYCRYEFEPEKSEEIVTDAGKLRGRTCKQRSRGYYCR